MTGIRCPKLSETLYISEAHQLFVKFRYWSFDIRDRCNELQQAARNSVTAAASAKLRQINFSLDLCTRERHVDQDFERSMYRRQR